MGLDARPNEDLFYTNKISDFWDRSQAFEEINSIYNEGSACLSRDGKKLYFARCDAPDTYGDCDIFMAEWQADSTWGNVRNLGPQVNGNAWDSHPSLSLNEDTLYFASDRLGGFGLSDIYYTYKNDKDEWQKSQNMGPVINTRNNDVSPFFHYLYNVLYFSSNGQNLNFGEFDIYKSYRNNGDWSEPQNIGPLVNGPGSEFYFTIDKKSEKLYYSRSTENNIDNLDLYSFPLPMEAQPLATTKVVGSIQNEETGQPLKGIVSIIDLENGIEVAPQFLRPDGTFEFSLINNANYLVVIQGDEYFRIEELFRLEGDTVFVKTIEPIHTKIKFESIVFGNGEAQLTPQMYSDLDKISDFMVDHPDFNLKISGHTDADGREDFNLRLSQERADAIKEYIAYFGYIDPSRIEAIGYGSSQPIVDEISDFNKQMNRRVEFDLLRGAIE
jgi:outer membrane protein OmpA-like peptidoglycan-associated protein